MDVGCPCPSIVVAGAPARFSGLPPLLDGILYTLEVLATGIRAQRRPAEQAIEGTVRLQRRTEYGMSRNLVSPTKPAGAPTAPVCTVSSSTSIAAFTLLSSPMRSALQPRAFRRRRRSPT